MPVKTIAGFWPLLAGIASKEQAEALAAELKNPKTSVASTACRRSPPTSRTTIRAEATGAARSGRRRHDGHSRTGTLRRRPGPRHRLEPPGLHGRGVQANRHRLGELRPGRDRTGQTRQGRLRGLERHGPILYLLEYAIGLQPDAPANTLTWKLASPKSSVASVTGSTARRELSRPAGRRRMEVAGELGRRL